MGDRGALGSHEPHGGQSPWPRIAYASAVAVAVLGTFASFGGISYAASGSERAVHTVAKVATGKHVVVAASSASSQYQHAVTKPQIQVKAVHTTKPSTHVALGTPKTTGTLPFTGFSLLGTALLSLALIATGLIIRVRERRERA